MLNRGVPVRPPRLPADPSSRDLLERTARSDRIVRLAFDAAVRAAKNEPNTTPAVIRRG
jgi:hypothetical protein